MSGAPGNSEKEMPPVDVEPRKAGMPEADGVEENDPQRHGAADPEGARVEDGGKAAARLVLGEEARNLGHGKHEALVFDPLPAHDDDDAEAEEVDGEDDAQPPCQRSQPGIERHRHAARGALVEVAHGVAVGAGDDPLRQVRLQENRPLVLRGCPVVGLGGNRQQRSDDENRDTAGYQPHGDDGDQLGRPQRP